MDNGLVAVKPKKRFSVGGILCVLMAFGIGIGLIYSSVNTFAMYRYYYYGIHFMEFLGFRFVVSNIFSGIIGLINIASWLVLGVLLICKVHSMFLVAFPAIQLSVLLVSFCGNIMSAISTIISYINDISYFGINASFFAIIQQIPFLTLLNQLIMMLVWVAIAAIIVINCIGKTPEKRARKLVFTKWIILGIMVCLGVLSLAGMVLPIFIGGRASFDVIVYLARDFFYGLDISAYDASALTWVVFALRCLASFVGSLFCAATVFFIVSWITKPYKKLKGSKKEKTEKPRTATEEKEFEYEW